MAKACDGLAEALREAFISPNVPDLNWEASNVVDVLYRLEAAVSRVALRLAPKPDREGEKCGDCCFFSDCGNREGLCRRNPPVETSEELHGRFPAVSVNTWCGEFRRKGG